MRRDKFHEVSIHKFSVPQAYYEIITLFLQRDPDPIPLDLKRKLQKSDRYSLDTSSLYENYINILSQET